MTYTALAVGLLAAAVGVWFLSSGFTKARHLGSIERSLGQYAVVPEHLARTLVLVLIVLEFAVGALLLIGTNRLLSTLFAATLLTVFAAVVAVDLVLGRDHSCGCGADEQPITWRLAGRNIGIALVLIWSAAQVEPTSTIPPGLTLGLVVLFGVVILQVRAGVDVMVSRRVT